MMISHTAEYALRAVVWLAGHADADLGTPEIARAIQAPPGYLSKVLQALSRARLVVSHPGRNGGFRLARPPADLSVLDIINAVDPIQRIRQCPLSLDSHRGELCPLHRRLDHAISLMELAFGESTIAELLAGPADITPACELLAPNERPGGRTAPPRDGAFDYSKTPS